MTARQIREIYSLGARLGIVGGDRNDDLHALVVSLTGKESVKDLSCDEYRTVREELKKRAGAAGSHEKKSKNRYEQSPAGMTVGQQKKVWQLMYELQKYDREPSTASLGERLCGIIKRELGLDAQPKSPFVWISYQEGSTLIERLKKYVYNAEKRYLRGMSY